jgi:hypothetical protein
MRVFAHRHACVRHVTNAELGSMPLGNGDVALNVWVDNGSGDLIFYVAKSDAFDSNSFQVKVRSCAELFQQRISCSCCGFQVGRVIVSLDPPLWSAGMTGYTQTLNVAEASISITTNQYSVQVFADANSDTVYVSANSSNGQAFSITASIDIYRNATVPANTEQSCYNYLDNPDTVVNSTTGALANAVVWYHRNLYLNATNNFYNDTMWPQGVNPDTIADPFINKTFGGAIFGSTGISKTSSIAVGGTGLKSAVITVVVLTTQPEVVDTWVGELTTLVSAQQGLEVATVYNAHVSTWAGLWGRSYIDIAPTAGSSTTQADVDAVRFHYVWQRFLDLCDGRNAAAPIKFNGQAFIVDVGKGPDYRDWGAAYWFAECVGHF